MNTKEKKRIGIIGYGQIGSSLYREIIQNPQIGFEVAFVYDIDRRLTELLPKQIVIENIEDFPSTDPDLVVEAAHPHFVREFAEFVLSSTDLMIMSVSAMNDANLEEKIKRTCLKHGTVCCIPHGATIGLDGLQDGREIWEEVTITMRKNPKNLDFRWAGESSTKRSRKKLSFMMDPPGGFAIYIPKMSIPVLR